MAEFRDIPFEKEWNEINNEVTMRAPGHTAIARIEIAPIGARVECNCGGRWFVTEREGSRLDDRVFETFRGHLSFVTRPALKPD